VIKGTSGNLGLERLYETAKDVEKSIKFNHDDVLKIQSGVDSFTEILKETLEAIKSFIADEKSE
jgi:HPt (histidine-containing phosphotransfer) domain-containing protein